MGETPEGKTSAASAAVDRVRAIVEAAEQSAAAIEADAREEAARIRAAAASEAGAARDGAQSEAAAHVDRVKEIAERMGERAEAIERELDELLARARDSVESLTGSLRTSAASLSAELDQLRAGFAEVRRPEAAAAGVTADAPVADAPSLAKITSVEAPVEENPAPPVETALADAPVTMAPAANEGARLIALNMALGGSPREETASYLAENFDLEDADALLDDVYARVGT